MRFGAALPHRLTVIDLRVQPEIMDPTRGPYGPIVVDDAFLQVVRNVTHESSYIVGKGVNRWRPCCAVDRDAYPTLLKIDLLQVEFDHGSLW